MTLFIGRLRRGVTEHDLEDIFYRYGKIVRCEVKHGGYGFVEFADQRDAEDALGENGTVVFGQGIVVERARGDVKKSASDSDECFYCKQRGHWARDCPDKRSETNRRYQRPRSRSRSRSRSPYRRGRDNYYREDRSRGRGRGRGRDRSRSPVRREEIKETRRRSPESRSPSQSPSQSPSRSRSHSSPVEN
jgi:RNA recognition motif-containing protein